MDDSTKMILGMYVLMYAFGAYVVDKKAEAAVEIAKAQQQELYIQDLNRNGLPEKFYEINGKKYFLEIDGKNLEDMMGK